MGARGAMAVVGAVVVLLPLVGRAQTAHTYAAHVEVRSGMCCSASCGAVSTLADVTLALAADGSATFRWVRRGCVVTISGPGPMHMPSDPGPPEAVCAMREGGAELRVLDGDTTQRGSWRRDGASTVVTLDHATTLRCVPSTIDGRALLACTIDGTGIDTTGLTLSGQLYLDDAPGIRERLNASDRVVIESR